MNEKSLEQRIIELEEDSLRLGKKIFDFNQELKGRGQMNQEAKPIAPLVEAVAKTLWGLQQVDLKWEQLDKDEKQGVNAQARSLLQFLSNHGVVRLDPDQTLPTNDENDIPNTSPRRVASDTQKEMVKAGWVKVLPLIGKEG
jgi:hypothetical protein